VLRSFKLFAGSVISSNLRKQSTEQNEDALLSVVSHGIPFSWLYGRRNSQLEQTL
jgi:hypothetical protein